MSVTRGLSRAHVALFRQLLLREVSARYRGSYLGLAWSFVLPLAMLGIYTWVFGVVFRLRWQSHGAGGVVEFALALFAGLVVFNFFAEVCTRAPSLITAQPNYVKKVVFPLDVLPLVASAAALFHAGMGLAVLVAALAVLGRLSWWVLALPLVWLPLAAWAAGLALFLSALGVYVRDTAQVVGPIMSALLFLSPVFYPTQALPEAVRSWIFWNPLSVPIEATRSLLLAAQAPHWPTLGAYALAGGVVAWLGWSWFARVRDGFADVL